MNTKIDPCDTMRNNLIAAAVGLQQCTKTASNIVHIPGGDRVIAIGTPAQVRALLPKRELPPELKAAIEEAEKTRAPGAVLPDGSAVFINYGDQPEDMAHLDCTACGGSGHIDDQTRAARDVLAERRRQVEAEGMTNEDDDGYHAAELPYLFDVGNTEPLDAAQQRLAGHMIDYWASFARTGAPAAPGAPAWAPATPGRLSVQALDTGEGGIGATDFTVRHRHEFWSTVKA